MTAVGFGRTRLVLAILAAALLFVSGHAVPAVAEDNSQVPQSREQITLSFAPLVRKAAPAVVNVFSRKTVKERVASPFAADPFFRRFFGDAFPGGVRERVAQSLGSGVILREDGLVVTNHHVIDGADEIRVVLNDRREYKAEVLRSDKHMDLAVLRLLDTGGRKFPTLAIRPSDSLEVGDLVLAIGNPFGVGQTVTSGIVSALARTTVGVNDFNFFIQTDAAVNPGNSGGALIGMDGQLVGINSAIYSRDGGSLGIGFAIPSEMVLTMLHAAEKGGPLLLPWFGAEGEAVTAEMAEAARIDRPAGVIIDTVTVGSPAARAGIQQGDVITEVDGKPVDDPQALKFRLATKPIGGQVSLHVLRGGKARDVAVALEAPPENPPRDTTVMKDATPLQGATAANLNPALAQEKGYADGSGVVLVEVPDGSQAGRLGFAEGDMVVSLNDQRITSVSQLVRALSAAGGRWQIAIRRDGQMRSMSFTR